MFVLQVPEVRDLEVFSRMPDRFRRIGVRSEWADANRGGQPTDSFLEGPVFDAAGNLYVTDIPFGRIFRIDPRGHWELVAEWEGEPNGMKFLSDKELLITDYRRGLMVCDIGSGPGYFTLRAARRVGEGGRVFAVDVEPRILDVLRTRIEKAGLRNVTPVRALASDPLLPPRSCDLVLIVDAYHHFPDRPRYLGRLAALLRPGGRLANVDWHKRKTDFGPELEHRVAREAFLADAAKAGLRLVAEPMFLQHQYFLILQ